MIQDRSSEGPYKDGDVIDVGGRVSKWVLNGYSEVKIANVAHAEGRKSMEKEIEEKKAIKDTLLCGTGFVMEGKRVPPEDVYLSETEIKLQKVEKEFKELLDLANQAGNFNQDMMQWKIKFEDWKKAQGIENRIRGGQDGE